MTNWQIIDLVADDQDAIAQTAILLFDGFQTHWENTWPNVTAALAEVKLSLSEDRISRVVIDENHQVLGWIGAMSHYQGNVWELHPLVVRSEFQKQGIGTALVTNLAAEVKRRGGITLWVGTDDENGMTSLGNIDLYPNVFEHIANIKNLRCHPYEFYQKMGFVIVGVMPDANGLGKPDIYMAKRVK